MFPALLLCLAPLLTPAQEAVSPTNRAEARAALIPYPREVTWGRQQVELTARAARIEGELQGDDRAMLDLALDQLLPRRPMAGGPGGGVPLVLTLGQVDGSTGPEGYELDVAIDGIQLTAPTALGLFRGVTTLRQLEAGTGHVPVCRIVDEPAFDVRGFMHDVGRNVQSVALLERWIDVMALHKLNVLHFHLTEYPGWRLESAVHPEVTSAASMWPTRKPGVHYTYADLEHLIDYARLRGVRLVPEFDMPGHSEAIRKATGLTMGDEAMVEVLEDLLAEFCDRIPAEDVPVVHLGTDEVWHPDAQPHPDLVRRVTGLLESRGRTVTVWSPGIAPTSPDVITQLWSEGEPVEGHAFVDSRANYVNHMDPFVGPVRAFFQQPCRQPEGDERALGGVLCLWNDDRLLQEFDLYRQNPALSAGMAYAERIWRGQTRDRPELWAKLPAEGDPDLDEFRLFERDLVAFRDTWHRDWPVDYVRQAEMSWQLTDPMPTSVTPADGPPDSGSLVWRDELARGGTLALNHFFGFDGWLRKLDKGETAVAYARTWVHTPTARTVPFWIDFLAYSRSGGRRGAPGPQLGQWSAAGARVWIAGREVAPPEWLRTDLGRGTAEVPLQDELFPLRDPIPVLLEAGWNEVLVEIPRGSTTRKWQFTLVPVTWHGDRGTEATDLRFEASRR